MWLQIYSQPWFAAVEGFVLRRVSRHWFVHKKLNVKIPGVGVVQLTLFRLVWRTLYVCFTTGSVCMHMLCHLMLGELMGI